MRGDPKVVFIEGEYPVRQEILEGAKMVAEVAAQAYGPISNNVAIKKSYGSFVVSHDGVTNIRELKLTNPVKDFGVERLVEASQKTNDISGDGTTATAILAYNIIKLANQRIAAGFNPMGLRRGIDKASLWVKEELDKLAVPLKDQDLYKVATIAASDPEIGKIVADTVVKAGGVGITIEGYNGLGVIQDVVEGLYFEKGWDMPHFVTDRTTEEAVHENVSILIVEKKIKQNQDIVPIIETVYKNTEHKTLLIIGHLDGQALETCALTNLGGHVKICVVRPPVYGDQELPFLEDVAALTGGKIVPSSLPADKITVDYLGNADKIIVAKDSTTIIGGKGIKEDISLRIENLKIQLKSDKYNAFQKERMEFRLAKLQGKIGVIKVGGATETEAKELKLRVEDAVNATRAAKEEGIVAGGAVTLAQLFNKSESGMIDIDIRKTQDEFEGFKVVIEALEEPFRQLMTNTGEDGGYRLKQVVKAPQGYGFDVNNMTEEPIDLIKAGILDPVKVLKSIVENASSAAGIAITTNTVIAEDREFQLEQVQITKALGPKA